MSARPVVFPVCASYATTEPAIGVVFRRATQSTLTNWLPTGTGQELPAGDRESGRVGLVKRQVRSGAACAAGLPSVRLSAIRQNRGSSWAASSFGAEKFSKTYCRFDRLGIAKSKFMYSTVSPPTVSFCRYTDSLASPAGRCTRPDLMEPSRPAFVLSSFVVITRRQSTVVRPPVRGRTWTQRSGEPGRPVAKNLVSALTFAVSRRNASPSQGLRLSTSFRSEPALALPTSMPSQLAGSESEKPSWALAYVRQTGSTTGAGGACRWGSASHRETDVLPTGTDPEQPAAASAASARAMATCSPLMPEETPGGGLLPASYP